jgi:hypothetical protein
MTDLHEKFIKQYNEEMNNLRDPKIFFDENEMIINPKKIKKIDLIGDLFLLFLLPLIISILLFKFNFNYSFKIFCIGVSLTWIIIILKTRAIRIRMNNEIKIDFEKELVTISPIDYLRKEILKQEGLKFSFNSIKSVETERIKFDKLNEGIRIILNLKNKDIKLIDIWTKSLGEELAKFIEELIQKK